MAEVSGMGIETAQSAPFKTSVSLRPVRLPDLPNAVIDRSPSV